MCTPGSHKGPRSREPQTRGHRLAPVLEEALRVLRLRPSSSHPDFTTTPLPTGHARYRQSYRRPAWTKKDSTHPHTHLHNNNTLHPHRDRCSSSARPLPHTQQHHQDTYLQTHTTDADNLSLARRHARRHTARRTETTKAFRSPSFDQPEPPYTWGRTLRVASGSVGTVGGVLEQVHSSWLLLRTILLRPRPPLDERGCVNR